MVFEVWMMLQKMSSEAKYLFVCKRQRTFRLNMRGIKYPG
jgi:hypothetical protein